MPHVLIPCLPVALPVNQARGSSSRAVLGHLSRMCLGLPPPGSRPLPCSSSLPFPALPLLPNLDECTQRPGAASSVPLVLNPWGSDIAPHPSLSISLVLWGLLWSGHSVIMWRADLLFLSASLHQATGGEPGASTGDEKGTRPPHPLTGFAVSPHTDNSIVSLSQSIWLPSWESKAG